MNTDKRTNIIRTIVNGFSMPRSGVDLNAVPGLCQPYLMKLAGDSSPKRADLWNREVCAFLLSRYYPGHSSTPVSESAAEGIYFYLDVLNKLLEREKNETAFEKTRRFALLTKDEAMRFHSGPEYLKLLSELSDGYLYAFMRLMAHITPWDTLGHIAGVHYTSMYIARQLENTPVRVDEALVSGAAILHDIGKYGCRPSEAGRVPYLHYYYTYQYAEQNGLPGIGQTASSHSVWDLELENLSVESLLLIYADFRVKSRKEADGREIVCFWTLEEAYQIILGKLDNVDEAKRRRYAKVYAKLKDFEQYLISLGVSTDLKSSCRVPANQKPYALMNPDEIVGSFKRLAIASNLRVMETAGSEASFISLLEEIRSEKDWRHIRAYLTVIGEYSHYLKQEQKQVILDFLYDMLSHQDGDIRRQSARIAARLIAGIELSFTKELPEGEQPPQVGIRMKDLWRSFLHRMLFPGHMVSEQHHRWIGYAMKTVVRSLLSLTHGQKRRDVLSVFMEHYKSTSWDSLTCFLLLDCLTEIPCTLCNDQQRQLLLRFSRKFLSSDDQEHRTAALRFISFWLSQELKPDEEMLSYLRALTVRPQEPSCIHFLIAKIRQKTSLTENNCSASSESNIAAGMVTGTALCDISMSFDVSSLYLENQRTEVPWIFKLVNLEILSQRMEHETLEPLLYQYAAHLLNMLQFADRVTVKLHAGQDLVQIMPRLTSSQRYEIVLELLRALDMGQYSAARYIPVFLGKIYTILSPDKRFSMLEQLRELAGNRNPRVVNLTLETVSIILEALPSLHSLGKTAPEDASGERDLLEGMLCTGFVHYNTEVALEAFYFLGQGIFGSRILTLDEKKDYFTDLARKVLTFIRWDELVPFWYYNAASLNHIYRFLSDYLEAHDTVQFDTASKIAFFPGTFDPFSSSHKAIVREIASMGFHVYLAVDEFSWSKNTQPYMIRRKIMVMSCADLKNVFLFPIEIPVNIACPDDLKRLQDCFPSRQVYIVAGSDVVAHASAYRQEPCADSIHYFPHILFARNTEDTDLFSPSALNRRLLGEVLFLKLPAYYENMSSTRIRTNVSGNKDITDLVEPVVQNYIYEKGLYTMEPLYKRAASTRPVDAEYATELSGENLQQFHAAFPEGGVPSSAGKDLAVLLRDQAQGGTITGAVLYHDLRSEEPYEVSGSIDLAQSVRDKTGAKTAVITGIFGLSDAAHDDRYGALGEMLEHIQEQGYSDAIAFDMDSEEDVLKAHGFLPVPDLKGAWMVSLRRPFILFFDTPSFIKEAFAQAPEVREILWECHKKLSAAIAQLFPGQLVLCFDSQILNHRLIRLITQHNTVLPVQYSEKTLGDKICVPFGKILKGVLVPECVTKDLNTEKLYDIDMEHFAIKEFPHYTSLPVQIRTIRSFMRPVLLVDDLYHKGHRLEAVQRVMDQEGLMLDSIIVAVMSGRGRDLAQVRHEPVESVYFIPNMRSWLIESDLYPFIGGDGIKVENEPYSSSSLPSVNSILPYQFPSFMEGASMEAFYRMSGVCLDNAGRIFRVLEQLYQKRCGRKLTMERLGEVLAEPRHPDTCILDDSVLQESPSALLCRETQKLHRLRHLLDGQFKM